MILGYGRRSRRATFAIAIIILLPLLFAPTTCAVREVREGRKAFRSFDERIRAYDSIMTASPDTAATARFSEIEYLGSFDAAGIRKSALIERGKQSEANLLEPHSKFARVAIAARDRARPVVMHGPENHAITVLKPTFGGAPLDLMAGLS